MIGAIIKGIFNLIISLISIILTPIDSLINQYLPSLADALNMISGFFDYIGDYASLVMSYTGLTSNTINIIIGLYTFILTVPILVSTIKLAVRWYNALKP